MIIHCTLKVFSYVERLKTLLNIFFVFSTQVLAFILFIVVSMTVESSEPWRYAFVLISLSGVVCALTSPWWL